MLNKESKTFYPKGIFIKINHKQNTVGVVCKNSTIFPLFVCLFSWWATVTGICADWRAAILITNHRVSKRCFSGLVLDAQRAAAPQILGLGPVHVADADPVVVLIVEHTPLWVVTRWLPSTRIVRDVFDVVHIRLVDLAEGFVTPRLPPPGLSEDVVVEVLPNSHVEISVWKKQSRWFRPLWVVVVEGKVQTWRTCKLD